MILCWVICMKTKEFNLPKVLEDVTPVYEPIFLCSTICVFDENYNLKCLNFYPDGSIEVIKE